MSVLSWGLTSSKPVSNMVSFGVEKSIAIPSEVLTGSGDINLWLVSPGMFENYALKDGPRTNNAKPIMPAGLPLREPGSATGSLAAARDITIASMQTGVSFLGSRTRIFCGWISKAQTASPRLSGLHNDFDRFSRQDDRQPPRFARRLA